MQTLAGLLKALGAWCLYHLTVVLVYGIIGVVGALLFGQVFPDAQPGALVGVWSLWMMIMVIRESTEKRILKGLLWLAPGRTGWMLQQTELVRPNQHPHYLARWISLHPRIASNPRAGAWAIETLFPGCRYDAAWSPASRQALEDIVAQQPGRVRRNVARKLEEKLEGRERGWLKRWLEQHDWQEADLVELFSHEDPEVRRRAFRKLGRQP